MTINVNTSHAVPVSLSERVLKRHLEDTAGDDWGEHGPDDEYLKRVKLDDIRPKHSVPFHGLLVDNDKELKIVDPSEAQADVHMPVHSLQYSVPYVLDASEVRGRTAAQCLDGIRDYFAQYGAENLI